MARGKGRISLRLYGSVAVAFLIPLIILSFVFIYLKKVDDFKYFFSGYGRDINIIEALSIDRQYTDWQNALTNFLTNQTVPALETFNTVDDAWVKKQEELAAKATETSWQEALSRSSSARQAIMVTVDKVAQSSLVYSDYVDTRIMPQVGRVEESLGGLAETLYSINENDAGDLVRGIIETFRQSVIKVLHFTAAPSENLMREVRASFIKIEDGLSQVTIDDKQRIADKITATRKTLSDFYTAVEGFGKAREDRAALQDVMAEESFQTKLSKVNPMAATDWQLSSDLTKTQVLEGYFETMNYILLVGFLVLVVGLIYAVTYIRNNFEQPMTALISYVSHAYVTRRRSPVPGMDRHDDIGLLARALHAMIERLQLLSEQQRGIKPDADESLVPAVKDASEIRDVTVLDDKTMLEPFLQLQDKTNEFNRALVKIGDHAIKASDQTSKTAELADQTRKTIQDTALAMQDLLQSIVAIHKASETQNAAVGLIDKHRSTGDLKIRSLQMSVYRLSDTVKALGKLCDQANLIRYNAEVMERNGSPPSDSLRRIIGELTHFSHALREALGYVDHEATMMKSNIQETVRSLYNLNIACKRDAEVSREIFDKTAAYKEAVMNQYSNVQNAAFQAGRLSLLLLDVSSDIVESSNVTTNLKYLAADMIYLAEQLKTLAAEAES